jgi:hypothetical protein
MHTILQVRQEQQVCPQSCGISQKKKTEKQTTHQDTQ